MYHTKSHHLAEKNWLENANSRLPITSITGDPRTEGIPSKNIVNVLVVDDDTLVRETFSSILQDQNYCVYSASESSEAFDLLEKHCIDVIVCDIFMPHCNGLELLADLQQNYSSIPIILITGHGTAAMAQSALEMGASDFITKPCSAAELIIALERNITRKALQRKHHQIYTDALISSNETVLDALLTALDTRDTETKGHSERVTAYTLEMAEKMGIQNEDLFNIERGALLHDIGKIGIPDGILLKPGKLTPEEWVEMRKHPVIGYGMCCRIDSLKKASLIVLNHHEAWDGTGYPNGIAGKQIPLGARIFAIADTLDAMTSDRPYRTALTIEEAKTEITRCKGAQFDPALVSIFQDIPNERWLEIREKASASD